MRVLKYVKLLPLLVIVSLLTFAVRIGDFMTELHHAGAALAQEEVHDAKAPPMPAGQTADAKPAENAAPAPVAPEAGPPDIALPTMGDPKTAEGAANAEGEESPRWQDGGDAAIEDSEVQASLYKDLVERRRTLEQREKDLKVREALLEAGERELEQKLREMMAIRNDIQGLLTQQSDEEKARVDSLVKIYEGMKAKDAAGIFNTLDMDVLIRIMSKMSERKSAPILAEMNPERARTVTILLAQQRQLPELAADTTPPAQN
jgi:flagellar motility protein MotE (MotC chaperone)